MEKSNFKKLVQEAMDEMPERFQKKLDNVALVVEDKPTQDQKKRAGVSEGGLLFGLYHGVPQTKRQHYSGKLPDKITIFQDSIEKVAKGQEEIKKRVKKTVAHEFAHHFGFDEAEVRGLGL